MVLLTKQTLQFSHLEQKAFQIAKLINHGFQNKEGPSTFFLSRGQKSLF
jgi:hypothetical protein